jgi:hypothetical protein
LRTAVWRSHCDVQADIVYDNVTEMLSSTNSSRPLKAT